MKSLTPSTTTATTSTCSSMAAVYAGVAQWKSAAMVRPTQGFDSLRRLQAGVAQSVERRSRKAKVVGSVPTVGSKKEDPMCKSIPLITTAYGSPVGSGVCADSTTVVHSVDNREVAGSTPAPRTLGVLDKFTAGAFVCASVAQLVEQRNENPRVAGSIPALGTMIPFGPLWRSGSASPTGSRTGCKRDSKTRNVGSIPSDPAFQQRSQ